MYETKTITLSKTMPLTERISEVKQRISEWLNSFEKPLNDETWKLRLKRYEQSDQGYSYQYEILSRKGTPSPAPKSIGIQMKAKERWLLLPPPPP